MFPRPRPRAGHYLLLASVAAGLFLVNLGGPSLWDIDEGNNAEAAREMMEAGNWVVPTFNFELRVDKPALLYWLQIAAYHLGGVNEFAARLPSALAALATVLLVYELGRLVFGATAGLLAGVVLAAAPLFCAAARFANPDALLVLFSTATLAVFWHGFARGGRWWYVPAGVCAGLAVLAKGPVGLVLPLTVTGLFLLWCRRLRLLFERGVWLGVLAFLLVALPWYAWVGAETKCEFLRGFILRHNIGRFQSTMENHGGSVFYYPLVLAVGLGPWSAFLGLAGWYGIKGLRGAPAAPPVTPDDPRLRFRFLWCWAGVYLVFFSLSGTKLPNYILPLYPPVALLLGHFLDGWRQGTLRPRAWVMKAGLVCLGLTGVALAAGLLVAGGVIPCGALRGRHYPGLEWGAVLGLVPLLAAAGAWRFMCRQQRGRAVGLVATASVLLVGLLAGWGANVLNRFKAPRELARRIHVRRVEPDVRVASYRYFQPSLVFYARREVQCFTREAEIVEFLAYPLPVYAFMPADTWEALRGKVGAECRVLGRRRDLYRHCDVVVVANR
jgi:4-amino-4-deoxy-L-arabinose transferase-like glycosyltransferase